MTEWQKFGLAAIGFLAFFLYDQWLRWRPLASFDFSELRMIGEAHGYEIRVLKEEETGHKRVGIAWTFNNRGGDNVISYAMTWADATQLAQLLRIAASPGRTIEEAKRNQPPKVNYADIRG